MENKISADTIIRTILLVVTLINAVLTMTGHNPLPFAEDELYTALSCLATIGATVWAWWKNNSFTAEAIEADAYMQELKATDEEREE